MKKYLKVIIALIIIIIAVVLVIIFKPKPEYTLKDIIGFYENKEIPSNMYFKEERVDPHSNETVVLYEIYKKDSITYERQGKTKESGKVISEKIYDLKNKYQIEINHEYGKFYTYFLENLQENEDLSSLTGMFNSYKSWLTDKSIKYEYCGKEELNGKEHIKFSINYNKEGKMYFYINLEDKSVSKTETYIINSDKTEELLETAIFTYSYNTVTDENIFGAFDISKYPEYEFYNGEPDEQSYNNWMELRKNNN